MFEGLKFLHSQPLDGSTCRLYSHIRHSLVGYNNFIHTYCLLKGYFLLTLKLFQTCMSFFLLLNAKEDILKNVGCCFFIVVMFYIHFSCHCFLVNALAMLYVNIITSVILIMKFFKLKKVH